MLRSIDKLRDFAALRVAASVVALAALSFGASQEMTGGSVAPQFRGDWVPGRAACG